MRKLRHPSLVLSVVVLVTMPENVLRGIENRPTLLTHPEGGIRPNAVGARDPPVTSPHLEPKRERTSKPQIRETGTRCERRQLLPP